MLGRTNITTVKGGITVSDMNLLAWNNAGTLNINSAFKKSLFANNILAAITKSGIIIYTRDGENWETADFNIDVAYSIADGIWDGQRFVFVGRHSTDQENVCQALIVATKDFQDYEIMRDCTGKEYQQNNANHKNLSLVYCGKFQAIVLNEDSTYTLACSAIANSTIPNMDVFLVRGDLTNLQFTCNILYNIRITTPIEKALDNIQVETAKNADSFMIYVKVLHENNDNTYYRHSLCISDNGQTCRLLEGQEPEDYSDTGISSDIVKIFECKGSLYYMTLRNKNNRLVRLRGFSDEQGSVVSTDKDWSFVDAVYFNKCEIFITANQMLVIKAGEDITDKTEEDLIDISYDFSLINIVKGFEKLYLFGTNGNILVSSDEIKNESATAVKTMSAAKALYDAKVYTDKKLEGLEERIAVLEQLMAVQ